jgi:hypothetical protein
MKGTEYFVAINECRYNLGVYVMVNSDELIGIWRYRRGAL